MEEVVICLHCNSLFHKNHIAAWLLDNNDCPNCKYNFHREMKQELRPKTHEEEENLRGIRKDFNQFFVLDGQTDDFNVPLITTLIDYFRINIEALLSGRRNKFAIKLTSYSFTIFFIFWLSIVRIFWLLNRGAMFFLRWVRLLTIISTIFLIIYLLMVILNIVNIIQNYNEDDQVNKRELNILALASLGPLILMIIVGTSI